MSNDSLAAVVTGANKGIGYEIVRQLSRQFQGTVYLTALNVERGKAAEKALHDEGLTNVKFLQIDVTDLKSIETAKNFVMKMHQGLDILINNAGVLVRGKNDYSSEHSAETVERTVAVNFNGVLNVCEIFFPILRAHARVVNISSKIGTLRFLGSCDLRNRLITDNLTVEQLKKIIEDYLGIAMQSHQAAVENGYPDRYGPYAMSKIAVTALSRIQQRIFDKDETRPGITVNACCPGSVATDLNPKGKRTTEEGADTPVYLALLTPSSAVEMVKPRGQFVDERKVINWAEGQVTQGLEIFRLEFHPM